MKLQICHRIQSCDGKCDDGSVSNMLVREVREEVNKGGRELNCFLIITCLSLGHTSLHYLFIHLKCQEVISTGTQGPVWLLLVRDEKSCLGSLVIVFVFQCAMWE